MTFRYRVLGSLLSSCLLLGFAALAYGKIPTTSHEVANSLKKFRESGGGSPAFKFKYQMCFNQAARRTKIPVTLLLAVARGESDFNSRAVSHANAIGIMQILWPQTAKELGFNRKSDLFIPCKNIHAGARYLRTLIDRYHGNYYLALAAYNYGPGRIKRGANPRSIPNGAQWYSAYILDHLQYVLGNGIGVKRKVRDRTVPKRSVPSRSIPLYSALGKYSVIVFNKPFRARAFREYLQKQLTGIRFDWFSKGLGRYEVVMSYSGKKEFQRNIQELRNLGLKI